MPSGGRITLAVEGVEMSEEEARSHADVAPGFYVCFSVADQGVGMTPEIRARLFEPFFTTKPVGKGTGLGLASSHGIVRQHHGCIRVSTAPGEGTTFRVYIPIDKDRRGEAPSGNHPAIRGRGEVILVVDDEPLIRDMIVSALESWGYKVLAADHGDAALAIAGCAERVDAVINDLVMPRLGGGDLMRRLRIQRPQIPALYISGYAEDAARPTLEAGDVFLAKPFTTSALARAMQRLFTQPVKSNRE
jgi:CheY-like chemotaxis protein